MQPDSHNCRSTKDPAVLHAVAATQTRGGKRWMVTLTTPATDRLATQLWQSGSHTELTCMSFTSLFQVAFGRGCACCSFCQLSTTCTNAACDASDRCGLSLITCSCFRQSFQIATAPLMIGSPGHRQQDQQQQCRCTRSIFQGELLNCTARVAGWQNYV